MGDKPPGRWVSASGAIQSLRAADSAAIDALPGRLSDNAAPVHIHVAEQSSDSQAPRGCSTC